jgi:hypothetical protein
MTVQELIAVLQRLPPEMPVAAHGCDCANFVTSVRVNGGVANLLNGIDHLDKTYDLNMKDWERR